MWGGGGGQGGRLGGKACLGMGQEANSGKYCIKQVGMEIFPNLGLICPSRCTLTRGSVVNY